LAISSARHSRHTVGPRGALVETDVRLAAPVGRAVLRRCIVVDEGVVSIASGARWHAILASRVAFELRSAVRIDGACSAAVGIAACELKAVHFSCTQARAAPIASGLALDALGTRWGPARRRLGGKSTLNRGDAVAPAAAAVSHVDARRPASMGRITGGNGGAHSEFLDYVTGFALPRARRVAAYCVGAMVVNAILVVLARIPVEASRGAEAGRAVSGRDAVVATVTLRAAGVPRALEKAAVQISHALALAEPVARLARPLAVRAAGAVDAGAVSARGFRRVLLAGSGTVAQTGSSAGRRVFLRAVVIWIRVACHRPAEAVRS